MLWSLAIRHAVLTGELDPRGLGTCWFGRVASGPRGSRGRERRAVRLQQQRLGRRGAAGRLVRDRPHAVFGSGRGLEAGVSDTDLLRMSLQDAVRGGRDADTVAAIAGGLVGAALARRRYPTAGGQRSTAGPGTAPPTSSGSRPRSSAAADRRGARARASQAPASACSAARSRVSISHPRRPSRADGQRLTVPPERDEVGVPRRGRVLRLPARVDALGRHPGRPERGHHPPARAGRRGHAAVGRVLGELVAAGRPGPVPEAAGAADGRERPGVDPAPSPAGRRAAQQ